MPSSAWIGGVEALRETLKRLGADVDGEGQPILDPYPASFMNQGDEFVVTDDTRVQVGGEWKPLYPELPTEGECKGIRVF
jgi:hypothetical protein